MPLFAVPSEKSAMRELGKNATYQEGAKAMEGLLPGIAINKFRSVLESEKLSDDARAFTSLALAEALIRSSLSIHGDDQQAVDALEILDTKELVEIPSTAIWQAEALASLGRYQDAEEALAQVEKKHPLFSQTQLARARIQMALNKTNNAVTTLNSLTESKITRIRTTANLLLAEIHTTTARYELAEKSLNNIDGQNPVAAKLKEYLQARLLMTEGEFLAAINQFQSLTTSPEHLSERIFRASILGIADAQAANGQSDIAIGTLLQYITDHPDSSVIQPFFLRLSQLLPEQLELDHPTLIKLREWSDEAIFVEDSLIPVGNSVASIPVQRPSSDIQHDRAILALYYRAKILARSNNATHHIRALALLARLRAIQPSQYFSPNELYLKLSSSSLLDTAYLHLKQNRPERATYTLEVMEKVAFSPELKDQASFLRGLLLAKAMNHKDALAAFNLARLSASPDIASAASINAGIMSLLSSSLTTFEKIADSHEKQKAIRNALILERALWKCSTGDIVGRTDLLLLASIFHHLTSSSPRPR